MPKAAPDYEGLAAAARRIAQTHICQGAYGSHTCTCATGHDHKPVDCLAPIEDVT